MSDSPDGQRGSKWSSLGTEQRNARSESLDRESPEDVVRLLVEEDRVGLDRVLACIDLIATASIWFAEAYGGGGTVLFVGAGTSGRLGVLEAAECPPTFNTDPARIRAEIAGGSNAVFRSEEGAEDRESDGRAAAATLGSGDLLVGLSASSVTPFVRAGLEEARRRGARSVLVTCAAASAVPDDVADLVIALDTGAEILTGSTRLKAGSATKAVLNAISTGAMVRLGKVYGNRMVDVQPSCRKLEDRARRIVAELGEVEPAAAQAAIDATGGRVKPAVLMARAGLSLEQAEAVLERAGGALRPALDAVVESRSESGSGPSSTKSASRPD